MLDQGFCTSVREIGDAGKILKELREWFPAIGVACARHRAKDVTARGRCHMHQWPEGAAQGALSSLTCWSDSA
jgi:hypothetical protein